MVGCLSVFVIGLLGVLGTGAGGYYFYKSQINKYTSEQPRVLPVAEIDEERLKELQTTFASFKEDVDAGKTPQQLILTEDDINAMISENKDIRGHVHVKIQEGKIAAEVSFPTDAIPGAKGRYFNGSISLNASLEDGVLLVLVQDAEVNGTPIPESFMAEFRKENLAKDIYKDPETAAKLKLFEKLEVRDNQIILTPKPAEVLEEDAEVAEPMEELEKTNQVESEDAQAIP